MSHTVALGNDHKKQIEKHQTDPLNYSFYAFLRSPRSDLIQDQTCSRSDSLRAHRWQTVQRRGGLRVERVTGAEEKMVERERSREIF